MKKNILIILAAAAAVFGISACSSKAADGSFGKSSSEELAAEAAGEKQLQIVTTIFPEYDWAREILGNTAGKTELTMLLDNGVDLHSYQPSAEDIMKISTCDLFIYVGGESDEWVKDALKEASNKDMKVIDLMGVLDYTVKEEEIVEGMETEKEEEGKSLAKIPEYDEHVWLSLKNAGIFCDRIADTLAEIDPENAAAYKANVTAYEKKMSDLDSRYQTAVNEAEKKTLLFGDRFPFRYLADDYGLSYYAAFVGCSAETEASFKTIMFLAGKTDELGLNSILTIEKSDQKIAKTITENTQSKDQKILALDSMQSTTSKDISNGVSYLSVMEKNLDVLKEALK